MYTISEELNYNREVRTKMVKELFPDGTPIDDWFYDIHIPDLSELGKQYVLTDYNIFDDGKIYTEEIQGLIDKAAQNGGGVIVVPAGTYMTVLNRVLIFISKKAEY